MPSASNDLPDWPRAHGEPLFAGRIKQHPEDFEVVEELGWVPSGDGEHDFLRIRKTGQNTSWVAGQLARHADVSSRDVGYSGMKDRHAVTTQWFSVRRPSKSGTDWRTFDVDGVDVLDVVQHHKKLRRGVHRMNRFRIVVRGADVERATLDDRLEVLSSRGVPNYFGPQRFGGGGRNLASAEAMFDGRRLKRQQRSIAISAARSFLFNAVLAERVRQGTWNTAIAGECFNLDGTKSVFGPVDLDGDIADRINELDIHPTGPLWGTGDQHCVDDALAIETEVLAPLANWTDGLSAAGAAMARRALRVRIEDLAGTVRDDDVVFSFSLATGAYAASVLREIGLIDA